MKYMVTAGNGSHVVVHLNGRDCSFTHGAVIDSEQELNRIYPSIFTLVDAPKPKVVKEVIEKPVVEKKVVEVLEEVVVPEVTGTKQVLGEVVENACEPLVEDKPEPKKTTSRRRKKVI